MKYEKQSDVHSFEEVQTLPQIIAAVHCKLIMDKLDGMNLSKEKRKEIIDKVINALSIKAQHS